MSILSRKEKNSISSCEEMEVLMAVKSALFVSKMEIYTSKIMLITELQLLRQLQRKQLSLSTGMTKILFTVSTLLMNKPKSTF